MVSEETNLDVVKQCIEMIEQEALSLMGGAPSLEDGKFEEVLSTLGGIDAVPKSSPKNLQDKLSLITKGMHLLSEQIQVKTEELKHVEASTSDHAAAMDPEVEPVTAGAGSHKIRYEPPESPQLLPPTPDPATLGAGHAVQMPVAGTAQLPQLPEPKSHRDWTPETSPQSQPQEAPLTTGATLYAETLARLAQSHEDMKHRILTLEAENKRLQEEATVRSLEERNRMTQIQTLLRDGRDTPQLGPTVPVPFAARKMPQSARSSKLKSRPDPPRSSTPEPPWRSTTYNRPPWQPTIPAGRAARAASSGRTTPPKTAASSGRTTPPKAPRPKGVDSVPAPAAPAPAAPAPARPAAAPAPARQAARASTMSSSLRSSASLTQSLRSSTSQVQAPRNLSRTSSPSRGGASSPSRGRTLSPSRGGATSSGTLQRSSTPAAPSSRPSSPRKFNEKELPLGWRQMVADAYCKETGRPFVDRIQLLDFTSTKKSEGSIYWVNARLRWADLRITEEGRVPKRGEVLALFVLQATPSPSAQRQSAEWLSNGRRAAPKGRSSGRTNNGNRAKSPSLPREAMTWQVASMRVLRNLPFHEQYSTVLMANIGTQLLHVALQMEIPRRVTHLVRPPSWAGAIPLGSIGL